MPPRSWVRLSGRNIIDGFRRLGYLTIGTGAVGWFDPDLMTSRPLVRPFDKYLLRRRDLPHRQAGRIRHERDEPGVDQPMFVFMNIGETHVPYWHQGACLGARRRTMPGVRREGTTPICAAGGNAPASNSSTPSSPPFSTDSMARTPSSVPTTVTHGAKTASGATDSNTRR